MKSVIWQPRRNGDLATHLKRLCNNLPLFTTNYDTFQEQAMGRYAVDASSMYKLEYSKLVKPGCLSLQVQRRYLCWTSHILCAFAALLHHVGLNMGQFSFQRKVLWELYKLS